MNLRVMGPGRGNAAADGMFNCTSVGQLYVPRVCFLHPCELTISNEVPKEKFIIKVSKTVGILLYFKEQ